MYRKQWAAHLPCTLCSWGGAGAPTAGPMERTEIGYSAVMWTCAHTCIQAFDFFWNHSKIICKHLVPSPINTSVCRFQEQRLSYVTGTFSTLRRGSLTQCCALSCSVIRLRQLFLCVLTPHGAGLSPASCAASRCHSPSRRLWPVTTRTAHPAAPAGVSLRTRPGPCHGGVLQGPSPPSPAPAGALAGLSACRGDAWSRR